MSPSRLRTARCLIVLLLIAALSGGAVGGATEITGAAPVSRSASAQLSAQAGEDPEGWPPDSPLGRCALVPRRWPNIADHIADVRRRYPLVLHIDRAGADENREDSLRGIPTKPGFDRDEYPPAVAREGGEGADVRYVRSSENRSAGSYMGNRLEPYCSGQPFRMLVVR